ncbi:MAG: GNAT family N-acetyltransferase [Bacteroidales bacterium]|nr:GNAT family N-acetyltransferase [Bacteroidales bacterium]
MSYKIEIANYNNNLENISNKFLIPPSILNEIYGNKIKFVFILKNSETVAVFCFYLKDYGILKIVTPPPFLSYNELQFLNNNLHTKNYHKNSFIKEILTQIAVFFKKNYKISIIKLTLSPQIKDMQPFYWENYKVIPFYTYQIDLQNPLDIIKSHFSSKKISLINKAIKDNLQVKETSTSELKQMVYLTFKRKNLLDKFELFQRFADVLHEKKILKIFSCYNNDILLGSCAFLEHSGTVYFMFSGHSDINRHPSVITITLYSAIQYYKDKGFKIFDFEGSMLKEVEIGFREFGGELIPYYSANYANLFLEMLLKLKLRNRF